MVRAGARWLGVTSVEEGVAARAVCPEREILVIGGVLRGQGAAWSQHRLTVVAWEPWHLDELEKLRGCGLRPGDSGSSGDRYGDEPAGRGS